MQLVTLLDDLVELFAADGVCAYLLETRDATFVPAHQSGELVPVSDTLRIVDDRVAPGRSARSEAIATAVNGMEPVRDGRVYDNRLMTIPIARGRTVVAVVEFLFPSAKGLSDRTVGELRSALLSLGVIHTEKYVEQLFSEMKRSLDFRLPRDVFLDAMGELILDSTRAQCAALRQLHEDQLVCVKFWGEDVANLRDLNIERDRYEPFRRACRGETVFEYDLHRDGLEDLASNPILSRVRSFVVAPINIAATPFGLLSVATKFRYEFPRLGQLGIAALANGIGVSLENYRAHHGATLALEGLGNVSASMTATEVAQAARHEALDLIHGSVANIAEIEELVAELPEKHRRAFGEPISDLTNSVTAATVAIDKIRLATRPPGFERKEGVAIDVVWRDALSQLKGRLDHLNILPRLSVAGSPPQLEIYRDWFTHIFLHLVLNSMDAYSGVGYGTGQPARRGREIVLSVDQPDRKANTVVFRYSDNAGGINPTKLVGPAQFDDLPFEQRLFAANVTSKGRQGSGWGLYLIRKILDLHDGSIDLERFRGGVTFRIKMPYRSSRP